MRLSDGVIDRAGSPTTTYDGVVDTGQVSKVMGVANDGSVICEITSISNEARYGYVDPYSMTITSTIGHASESGAYSTEWVDDPYLPFAMDITTDISGEFFAINGFLYGDISVVDILNWPAPGFEDTEIRCFMEPGGGSWRDGSSRGSSSLRLPS